MLKTIPLVSVLIVNYNGKEFIAECLDSVLQTDYPKFEIVLVDNGSTDQSVYYITKQYEEALRSKKIRLIQSQTNLYFTGGSNLAAKYARGEKLIFLNNDTVVTSTWIKELILCTKNKQKYLIQPKILLYSKKNSIDNVGGRYIFPGFGFGIARGEQDRGQYDQTREIDFANGTCFMIDKSFFWRVGGFDESYDFFYEDVDLNLKAERLGAKSFCCGKSIIYHKNSLTIKNNISDQMQKFYARTNRLKTVNKNFSGLNKKIRFILLLIFFQIVELYDNLLITKDFFPNIPALTYIFTLKKILSDCRTVLDIGCGASSPLRLIPATRKIGIDADKKALETAKKNKTHDAYYLGNVKNISTMFKPKQFDACAVLDVIEHLSKTDGYKLIKDMEKIARKRIVIFTPNGFLSQDNPTNPFAVHRSGWTAEEMVKLGFHVIGMFGHTFLKGEGYGLRFRPKIFWGIVSEFTHYFFTRLHPHNAAGLLCIKELKDTD